MHQDWCQHLQRQLASEIMYCWKAEVGRQQKFAINSIKLDNEELNRDLMFTNKALQIMTPISHGYEKLPSPQKPLKNDFSLSKELERFGLTSDTSKPITYRF